MRRTSSGSQVEALAQLPESERRAFIANLTAEEAEALHHEWRFWARANQLPPDWDWRIWAILAGRGFGKALDLKTLVPTPSGWSTMGELQDGDEVFDERGCVCKVVKAHDVLLGRDCYRLTFSDGTSIVADGEHLWLTTDKPTRKALARRVQNPKQQDRPQCVARYAPRVVTTLEIAATLRHGKDGREVNHSIECCNPLQLPEADLPVDPYVLGIWLGDGNSREAKITTEDPEVLDFIEDAGERVRQSPRSINSNQYSIGARHARQDKAAGGWVTDGSLYGRLKQLGVINNKHIPDAYLRGSEQQRRSLLAGLIDSDGHVSKRGQIEFTNMNFDLADGVLELARTLGFKPTVTVGTAMLNGKDCGPKARIKWTAHVPVCRLPRKLARQHSGKSQAKRISRRYIVSVEKVPTVPVRCITVDSPSRLYLAGEGMIPTHNTRAGSEWVIEQVRDHGRRHVALVAAVDAEAGRVMVEGDSGILACSPPGWVPRWNPSKGQLRWPNGAMAQCYSAEKPASLRGPNNDAAWVDELAKFRYPESWDQLLLTMRLGPNPQVVVTTTPKPTPIIKNLLHDKTVAVTRGTTYDNRSNLPPAFFAEIVSKYEGTRLGRQELQAEILDDAPGALWSRDAIDADRRPQAPELQRIVVAIDPSVSSTSEAATTGIVVAGLGIDGHGYLLTDGSLDKPTPEEWARQAVSLFHKSKADRIVAEVNNGGDLVESTIRAVDKDIPYKAVRASRGKAVRAEPVAALSEQHRIHHVGSFPELEDELCEFEAGISTWSPNRLDAYVWAFTSLMLGGGRATYDPRYSAYLPSLRI